MDVSMLLQAGRRLKTLSTIQTGVESILAFTRFAGIGIVLFDLMSIAASQRLSSFGHSKDK